MNGHHAYAVEHSCLRRKLALTLAIADTLPQPLSQQVPRQPRLFHLAVAVPHAIGELPESNTAHPSSHTVVSGRWEAEALIQQ